MDIVRKSGDKIDSQKLGAALGCEVVETAAIIKVKVPYTFLYAVYVVPSVT
ncbi:hypothetical protein ACPUYX_18545 [Desulfosporosinus sp. SYSU MS00001]|uniref:hypothetical protein n=1 Tax=Desulfosporosinus sp. SYSU MS00001 TaxID=3416284 RepID=UPI003CE715C7